MALTDAEVTAVRPSVEGACAIGTSFTLRLALFIIVGATGTIYALVI